MPDDQPLMAVHRRVAENVMHRPELARLFGVLDAEIARLDAAPLERARALLERQKEAAR